MDVKCNIASYYRLAFKTRYSAFHESEEILSMAKITPPLTEHYKSCDKELVPNILGRMVSSLPKIAKRTSNNNAIAYWSQQTYALFYTQARTPTTVLDMPNTLHNQTRSPWV